MSTKGSARCELSYSHRVLAQSPNRSNFGIYRFVYSPTNDVENRLSSQTAELKSDITNLNKKLHYLETTHKNSREHIDQIFRSGGRS